MEIDCHYYGTFHMACLAGFSPSEAKEIAWAAQTVDEMSYEKVKELRNKAVEQQLQKISFSNTVIGEYLNEKRRLIIKLTEETYNVFTYQTTLHLFSLSNTGMNENQRELKMIRGVWVPFHFLPAGMAEATALYNKVVFYNTDDEAHLYERWRRWNDPQYRERNRNDTMLICRHSTELSKKMINETMRKYREYNKNGEKLKALYAVGICMHVLADTWSHQGFSGSCNQVMNQGDLYDAKNDVGRVLVGGAAVALSNIYSTTWTGHGSVGTNPDIPGNSYTYIANYVRKMYEEGKDLRSQDETTKYIMSELIHVNNKERFSNAFFQMYEALYSIKNEMVFQEGMGKTKIYNDMTVIQECLFTDEKDTKKRCEKWKLFLLGRYTVDALKEYSLLNGEIESFLKMAKEHRNYIMDEVSKTLFNASDYMSDINKFYVDILIKEEIDDIDKLEKGYLKPAFEKGPKYI